MAEPPFDVFLCHNSADKPNVEKIARQLPKLPVFLEGMTYVGFRAQHPDPMDQLIWGDYRGEIRAWASPPP